MSNDRRSGASCERCRWTNSSTRQAIRLRPGAEIWLASDDAVLSPSLEQRLRKLGYRPRLCVSRRPSRELERPAALGGLVIAGSSRQPEDERS